LVAAATAEDLDPVDHATDAADARRKLLCDLLEVVGGKAAVEIDDTAARDA
jgi:hypothetical protein